MPKVTKAGLRPTLDVETMAVIMHVKEDDNILAVHVFSYDALERHPSIQHNIMLHGLSTLLQQRTSDVKADPERKLEAMKEVYERLIAGEWTKERKAGSPVVSLLVEAVVEAKRKQGKDITVAQAQKAVRALSDDDKGVLEDNLSELMDTIREARASDEGTDLDDLL
jgi:hypothetical protein